MKKTHNFSFGGKKWSKFKYFANLPQDLQIEIWTTLILQTCHTKQEATQFCSHLFCVAKSKELDVRRALLIVEQMLPPVFPKRKITGLSTILAGRNVLTIMLFYGSTYGIGIYDSYKKKCGSFILMKTVQLCFLFGCLTIIFTYC